MKDSLYGPLCAAMLGLGQMLMFSGYDTQSFVVEPVLHSVHDKRPAAIDAHAGYYGTSICWAVFTVSCLIAPSVVRIFGSKVTLFLGSVTFTLYLVSFFYVHWFLYYSSTSLMGLGFALYYIGNGGYMTEHSTRSTIERNSALNWAIAACCMVVGGVVMLLTTRPPVISSNLTEVQFSPRSYRVYSDGEIRLMYGAFALACLLSNLVFALLPSRRVANSLAELTNTAEYPGFFEEIAVTVRMMADRRLIQSIPVFTFLGISTGFWIMVYPTTLVYTRQLSLHYLLPAWYSIALGTGDMGMGLLLSALSKRIPNFGQKPTIILGTPLPPPLVPSSVSLSLLIGFLLGLADNCINTSRTVLCSLVVPDAKTQVFAISKFHQNWAASALVLAGPFLSIPLYFVVLVTNGALSVYFYLKTSDEIRQAEREVSWKNIENTMQSGSPRAFEKILGSPPRI